MKPTKFWNQSPTEVDFVAHTVIGELRALQSPGCSENSDRASPRSGVGRLGFPVCAAHTANA
jgi:hypothetical protein